MRAAVRDRYGTPEVVRLEEVDTPSPTDDQVLVRVVAASVNRGDLDGLYPKPRFVRLFMGLRAPRTRRIGIDMAGVVEAVGPQTSRFSPGDQVFTDMFTSSFGSFAEYVCVPERTLETIPDGLTLEEASTLPHGAVLALQGLRLRNGRSPRPGDRVLVGGASGSVGPFLVQIAKHYGAEVTAVARGDKLDFARSLGADHVIDYTRVDYTRTGDRYDWIVDVDAHHSLLDLRRALKPGGVYDTLGGSDARLIQAVAVGPVASLASGKKMGLMLWWKPFHKPDVATLKQLIAAGAVKPRIDRTFPLTEVVEALRYVDDGHARGKVVVVP
jgi:NADPH:quinone reductase-like Zn-dependent oxidoreductase